MATLKAKFKFTPLETPIDGPALVTFPNGAPALDPENRQPVFQLLGNTDPKKAAHRVLHGEVDNVEFFGSNFGANSSKTSLSKFAVGIVKSGKGKDRVKLFEVNHLYSVSQHLTDRPEMEADAKSQMTFEDRQYQRLLLEEGFGTSKRHRAMRSTVQNRVKIEDKISEKEIQAVRDQLVDTELVTTEASLQASREKTLPPHNLEAKVAKAIYRIKGGLIPDEVWSLLTAMKLSNESLTNPNSGFGAFVRASSSQVEKHKEPMLYFHYLQRFLMAVNPQGKQYARDVQSSQFENLSTQSVPCPEAIKLTLLQQFASRIGSQKYHISLQSLAKILCHLFVLAMVCHDFELPDDAYRAIQEDIKLSAAKCDLYFREIGCKLPSGGMKPKKSIVLTAPLKLPTMSKGPKKRKK
jgi:hypothetical protein